MEDKRRFPREIYKDCDIRGVYGQEFDERDAFEIGRGIATLRPGQSVLVGGDARLSTGAIKARLIEGLLASGAKVTDIGTVPTPALYFAISRRMADGGVMVTASHNPPRYNGFKFMFGDRPVTREAIDNLRRVVEAGDFADGAGTLMLRDVLREYVGALSARFAHLRGGRPLRAVVDAGNGAMSEAGPAALAGAGVVVEPLFCEFDGRFPNRPPNPTEYDKLTALRESVLKSGADFGVAFDGDGDRAVFCDERAEIVTSERSLVLFIRHLLKERPGPVVYDQKSSSVVKKAILQMGGEPVMERSGHTFIKRRFLDLGAPLAGEVSGHFFFGELGYDDGLYAALLMATILKQSGRTLSALLQDVVCPPITPDVRLYCPYDSQDEWLDRIRALGAGAAISEMDGVRIDFPFGWLLARKSVTAEQITLRAEGRDADSLKLILRMAADALPEAQHLLQSRMLPIE